MPRRGLNIRERPSLNPSICQIFFFFCHFLHFNQCSMMSLLSIPNIPDKEEKNDHHHHHQLPHRYNNTHWRGKVFETLLSKTRPELGAIFRFVQTCPEVVVSSDISIKWNL